MVEFCKIKLSAVEEVCCQTLCLKVKFIFRFIHSSLNKTTDYFWGYPQVFWGGHSRNDNGRYFQCSAELA